ncbi:MULTISPECIES: hypothetical protein [Fischerella]|uniref:hypothetical protein n=1 Tax=Fischerella TaxID=1190 RepID=UPI00031B50A4|nr:MULTISPECIES: hypothetical protein [Fischerella]MBD2434627.1 hypothetical protein [Fischerella sp. FACHB-380]
MGRLYNYQENSQYFLVAIAILAIPKSIYFTARECQLLKIWTRADDNCYREP